MAKFRSRLAPRNNAVALLSALVIAGAALVGSGVATAAPAANSHSHAVVAGAVEDVGVFSHCKELKYHPPRQRGSKSDVYVGHLQCLLKYHYGQNIAVDRDFGPATQAAVRRVQAFCGVSADGIVGPITWRILHRNGTC